MTKENKEQQNAPAIDINRILSLNLTDKNEHDEWNDAVDKIYRAAIDAICCNDYESANAYADTLDQILNFPRQAVSFREAVRRLDGIWTTLVSLDDLFDRFDKMRNFIPLDNTNN